MVKSVYIHIPFCNNICSYCDFCKIYYDKKWSIDYLNALKNEINNNYKGELLDTIYIGGGTPSSLDIDELTMLFNITKLLKKDKNCEFTIECNIEDITKEKLMLFKKNNINRLSIGVQSFNNTILKYLGRNYDKNLAIKKIKLAKKYFNNINIDLIYAVQGQSLKKLEKDLDIFLKLDINHVSCYSLMIEKNTKLYIDNIQPISEDLDFKMYELIYDKLSNKLNRYEISNYSKEGYESKHNMKYWLNQEYYGFGLAASGYIGNNRYTNTKNFSKYLINNSPSIEKVSKDDKIKYELILGLRLIKGINKKEFYKKYNIELYDIANIKDMINKGYIKDDGLNIYVDKKYLYVINDLLVNFV